MKIGLVIPANLKYSPYVKYYTDVLKRKNAEYRIMSWDKVGIREPVDMVYSYHTSDFDRKKILLGHVLFAVKCRKYIKKEKIDHLIIFTQAPLFFLGYGFLKRFRDKLFIDIRDDSPFRRHFQTKLNRISELAHTLAVSSPYYAEWFSRGSIHCHNVDMEMLIKYSSPFGKESISLPARLVFAGYMIEEVTNTRMIGELSNSDIFNLLYVGNECDGKAKLRQFVQENHIKNVSFEGEYRKENIVEIYRSKADLVNILREKTLINRNALPNKLYDAVLSGIPIVVYDHNEAIANYVKRYKLGAVITEQDDFCEQLKRYISTYSASEYMSGRNEFLNLIKSDMEQFEVKLSAFIEDKNT